MGGVGGWVPRRAGRRQLTTRGVFHRPSAAPRCRKLARIGGAGLTQRGEFLSSQRARWGDRSHPAQRVPPLAHRSACHAFHRVRAAGPPPAAGAEPHGPPLGWRASHLNDLGDPPSLPFAGEEGTTSWTAGVRASGPQPRPAGTTYRRFRNASPSSGIQVDPAELLAGGGAGGALSEEPAGSQGPSRRPPAHRSGFRARRLVRQRAEALRRRWRRSPARGSAQVKEQRFGGLLADPLHPGEGGEIA